MRTHNPKTRFPWPYNLIAAVFDDDEDGNTEIDADQERGLLYAINTLTEREKSIVLEYFQKGRNLEDIGNDYNVTRERIRQVLAKAERKLRHPSRANYIRKGYMIQSGELYAKTMERLLPEIERAKQDAQRLIDSFQSIGEEVDDGRNTEIDALELSVRSYNCLARAGLRTVGDILESDPVRMKMIRNMGRKSLVEIYSRLAERGYRNFDNGEPLSL